MAPAPKEAIDASRGDSSARTPRSCGDPPPQAIFVGFGDSSINFELRAWTDEFVKALRIRTDLGFGCV